MNRASLRNVLMMSSVAIIGSYSYQVSAVENKSQNISVRDRSVTEVHKLLQIEDLMNDYVVSVLQRDASMIEAIMTDEAKERIFRNLGAQSPMERAAFFLEREHDKLMTALGSDTSFDGVKVISAETEADGVLAVEFSYHGMVWPKMVYFVEDSDGDLRLSLMRPKERFQQYSSGFTKEAAAVPSGCDTGDYTVKNKTTSSKTFSYQKCSGSSWVWQSITVGGSAIVRVTAVDTCGWGYDSTSFKLNGAEYHCDYEIGVDDFYITGTSSAYCSDYC